MSAGPISFFIGPDITSSFDPAKTLDPGHSTKDSVVDRALLEDFIRREIAAVTLFEF